MSTAVPAPKRSHQAAATARTIPMHEKPTANIELSGHI
jgi:hypothetical protein